MVLDSLKIDMPCSIGHMQDIAWGIPWALRSRGDSSASHCMLLRATLATLMVQDKTTKMVCIYKCMKLYAPVPHTAH